MRRSSKILELTKSFHEKKKPIAFICHAGWVLASADVLKGVRCTSFFSIKDDLIHAGAIWIDEPLVIDKQIISSRNPGDLPYFCLGIIQTLTGELVRV